jgi:hypothetical protein
MANKDIGICKHCNGELKVRNPKGFCDHLYYPENCFTCGELMNPKQTREEILEEFKEKFGMFAILGTLGRVYNGGFANGVTIREAQDFISQSLDRIEAQSRGETAREIATLAFQDIKDPNSERDYELVLYYCRKINPDVHVKKYAGSKYNFLTGKGFDDEDKIVSDIGEEK